MFMVIVEWKVDFGSETSTRRYFSHKSSVVSLYIYNFFGSLLLGELVTATISTSYF